jgi:glutamate/tyrosine decarboxylase-like PLP-dependent enzyme
MATFTGLSVGLRVVLRRHGWDLATDGLRGAPPVRVFAGANRHGTVDRALRLLGLGTAALEPIDTDAHGRLDPAELARVMERCHGPALVCAQVGDVNTGAVDDVGAIARVAHARGAWVHVDGAFGLWAAASPRLRPLVAGLDRADSWATDAHKWLNVPYDSGLVLCAHPDEHRATMGTRASYLVTGNGDLRDGLDFGPEHSRRARGFAVHAALRSLGRDGVADLVERSCALAGRLAAQLADVDGLEVLNEVVLNQVLVRATSVDGADADGDRRTRRLVERVQADGTAWMSGTTWQGRAALRVSVSNWSTDADDIDRTVATLVRLVRD